MSGDYEKRLDFDSDTFKGMKKDMNFVLQRLIGNMRGKDTGEGSMTLKIDVTMVKEFIPNYDPGIKGETREVNKPQFKHKVTSAVKINDEKSGSFDNEMELVMDEDTGVFKLVPIANTAQRSIFDADFQQEKEDESFAVDDENIPRLPGTIREAEVIDGEFSVVESTEIDPEEDISEEELEDITDELLGMEEPEDGYGYEEPEEG